MIGRTFGRVAWALAIVPMVALAGAAARCTRNATQTAAAPDASTRPAPDVVDSGASPSGDAAAAGKATPGGSPSGQTELVRAVCATEPCPVQLRVRRAAIASAYVTLGWSLPPGPIAPRSASGDGVTAGLACPVEPRIWSVGREEKAATVAVCDVNLDQKTRGLLVAIEAGFEHVKRRFELYAPRADAWTRTWFEEDPQGPTTSALVVRADAAGRGRDQLVRFRISSTSGTAKQPDRVVTEAMLWDKSTLVHDKLAGRGLGLSAVVVGPFPDTVAARRAQAAAPDCLGAAVVLPAAAFPGQGGKIVLAMPSADSKRAEVARSAVSTCAPDLKTNTAAWPTEGE
jgi:hypothetical protein